MHYSAIGSARLGAAVDALVHAQAALTLDDRAKARTYLDSFWQVMDEAYDDLDAADDVAAIDRALAELEGDERCAGAVDELQEIFDHVDSKTPNHSWATALDEARDDLRSALADALAA